MNKDDLYELALTALATGAGGLDETLFGLPQKYSESVRKLKKESPTAFGVGQVGSYFVPGTGIVGGAKLGSKLGMKALRALLGASKGIKTTKEMGTLAKVLSGAAKGATGGAVEGGGQVLAREALGTGEGNAEEEAISGGSSGLAFGALSPAVGRVAKKIYSHPAIRDTGFKRTDELIKKLMDSGVWGDIDEFQKFSDKQKKKYVDILSPYRKQLADRKVTFDDVVGAGREGFAGREAEAASLGRKGLTKQFKQTREAAKEALGPDPTWQEVMDFQETANRQLSDLSNQKRAKAISGRGQREDAAIGAMKGSIDRLEGELIEGEFGKKGMDKLKEARDSWKVGRDVERSLDAYRPQESPDWIKTLMTPATSMETRTGLGLLLNKLAKSPGGTAAKISRGMELSSRKEPKEKDPFADIKKEIKNKPKNRENKIVKEGVRTGELDDLWKELE